MSHERSETVEDPKTGKWVNVYGRGTGKRGQRLPADASGLGHREYPDASSAADEARRRSEAYREGPNERAKHRFCQSCKGR